MGYYGGGKGEPGSIQAAYDEEQKQMSPIEYDRAIRDEQQKQRQQAVMAEQARYPDAADSILRHAATIVAGDRAAQHGPKERNHQNIADHWNAYLSGRLDKPLEALDVALMMVELKVARTKAGAGRSNPDNYVDMAGYAGVAGEIAASAAGGLTNQ